MKINKIKKAKTFSAKELKKNKELFLRNKAIKALNRIDEFANNYTCDDFGDSLQLEKDYNTVFDYISTY